MKVGEVLACAFPSWYSHFEKVTFRSHIIPIPRDVLDYLLDNERLVLPKECNGDNYNGREDDYDEFGDVDWDKDDDEGQECVEQKTFPEFSSKVMEQVAKLGGEVFCKLNWSCPKDAAWIAMNSSLKCSTLSQIYLLLKSSDFIVHDLTQPFIDCSDQEEEKDTVVDYCLVLRKWREVNPGTEWRCFVKNQELIAVCQRDTASHYPHMAREEGSVRKDLNSFFSEHIRDKFPLQNYTFDVTRPRKDKVILVDFNPFGQTTDGLMFEWEELENWDENLDLELRYIRDSVGVQPNPHRHYSLPRDMVDLATGTDPSKLVDFLRLQGQIQGVEGSDDEEDS